MTMKTIRLHKSVVREVERLGVGSRLKITESLDLLAAGKMLGMPQSRPMPSVAPG